MVDPLTRSCDLLMRSCDPSPAEADCGVCAGGQSSGEATRAEATETGRLAPGQQSTGCLSDNIMFTFQCLPRHRDALIG